MKIKSNLNVLCTNVQVVTFVWLVPKVDAIVTIASMRNAMFGIELSSVGSCKHAKQKMIYELICANYQRVHVT